MKKLFVREVVVVMFLFMLLNTLAVAEIDSVFIGTYDLLNDSVLDSMPIEWYIIEVSDDSCTLLSRYAVAQRRIHATPETSWKNTELSRWLNNEFYQEAFNDQEKQMIIEQYDGHVSLLKESDNRSVNPIIKNNPKIMLLEQTNDFQQKKWWLKLYPGLWLGLGHDKTRIRPAYDAKLFGDLYGGGIGYYEAATYYAIEEDGTSENGYSVLEYGYPINEPLAVRPVIVVDRDYVFQLLGINVPNSESKNAIIVEGLIEALNNPKDNIFETLKPVFGDISILEHHYMKNTLTADKTVELEDAATFSIDEAFYWGQHEVLSFSISSKKYKEYFDGQVMQRVYLSILDPSPQNEYTESEVFGDTKEYYNTNENWYYVHDSFPYREQKYGAGMKLDRDADAYIVGFDSENQPKFDAIVNIILSISSPDYDFDDFYTDSQFEDEIISKDIDEMTTIIPQMEENVDLLDEQVSVGYEYSSIGKFHEGFAWVCKDKKWGFVDKSGDLVVPCEWDNVYYFNEGLAAVKRDGKWGFINRKGDLVIPCEWDAYVQGNMGIMYFENNLALVKRNGKYGYINNLGELSIPCEWDAAQYKNPFFHDGLALVVKDGKHGFINTSGELVVPCVYDSADYFSEGYARVKLKGNHGFVDKQGNEVIPCDDKWGYLHSFHEGLAYSTQKGFIDSTGQVILTLPDWMHIMGDYCEGYVNIAGMIRDGSIHGFVNRRGEVIVPCEWDFVFDFSEGLAAVGKDDKMGFVNTDGILVIPCDWDSVFRSFSNGVAIVKKDGKYGLINRSGETVIPCVYDYLYSTDYVNYASIGAFENTKFSDGFVEVLDSQNSKWGIFRIDGTEIIPCEYDSCNYGEGYFTLLKDGQLSIIQANTYLN